jgi:uncharacterized OB-fold protein
MQAPAASLEDEEPFPTSILMIKCRNCGHEHPSVIQMGASDFKIGKNFSEKGSGEQCPKCGIVSIYNKSDYFFL